MFINCHACRALVATDPVDDQPPAHCPRCGARLRADGDTAPRANTPAAITTAVPTPRSPTSDAPRAPATSRQDIPPATAPADIAGMLRDPATTSGLHAQVDASPAPAPADSRTVSPLPDHAPAAPAPDIGQRSAPPAATPPALDTTTDTTPEPASRNTPPTSARNTPRPSPSFAATHARVERPRMPRWLAAVTILVLFAALLLQVLLADRARFAASPAWRPLLEALCNPLGCQLPAWHEPAAFALLARDVRAHPDHAGVLRVTATFRNDARWAQAWPQLQLRLSDVNGQDIASRDFGAEQYLADTPHAPVIASGQTATIRLDVREPATEAVSFAFDLH